MIKSTLQWIRLVADKSWFLHFTYAKNAADVIFLHVLATLFCVIKRFNKNHFYDSKREFIVLLIEQTTHGNFSESGSVADRKVYPKTFEGKDNGSINLLMRCLFRIWCVEDLYEHQWIISLIRDKIAYIQSFLISFQNCLVTNGAFSQIFSKGKTPIWVK